MRGGKEGRGLWNGRGRMGKLSEVGIGALVSEEIRRRRGEGKAEKKTKYDRSELRARWDEEEGRKDVGQTESFRPSLLPHPLSPLPSPSQSSSFAVIKLETCVR